MDREAIFKMRRRPSSSLLIHPSHFFKSTLPTPVNIIADRRAAVATPLRGVQPQPIVKVKRGWLARVVAQCHCGCRQYRVTVLNLVDVILPVDVLRIPPGSMGR